AGPAREGTDHFVAELLVERRCLIAMGVEMHLMAAAAPGLGFSGAEQARAQAVTATGLVDPYRLHESGPTPRPAVHARHDRAVAIAHEDRQRTAVVDTARRRVELVEPFVQDRDVLAARIVLDPQIVIGHRRRCPAVTPCGPRRPRARARGSSRSSGRRLPDPSP